MSNRIELRNSREYKMFECGTEERDMFIEHSKDLYFAISDILNEKRNTGIPDFMTLIRDHELKDPEFHFFSKAFVQNEFPELNELEIEDFLHDHFYTLDSYYISDVISTWEECKLFFIDQTQTNSIINQPYERVW